MGRSSPFHRRSALATTKNVYSNAGSASLLLVWPSILPTKLQHNDLTLDVFKLKMKRTLFTSTQPMSLDLVTMRAYVTHSLTMFLEMCVYLLTYLLIINLTVGLQLYVGHYKLAVSLQMDHAHSRKRIWKLKLFAISTRLSHSDIFYNVIYANVRPTVVC